MKEVKKIAEGKNFSAVDFGKLNELGDICKEWCQLDILQTQFIVKREELDYMM